MVMTISMANTPPPSMIGGRDSVRRCQAYEACEIPEVSIGYAHVMSKYATIPTAIVIPMEGETQTFRLSLSSSLSSRLAKEFRHTRIFQFYLNPSELTGKGGRTMSNITKSTLKIDGKFWKIRTRTNGPKVNHMIWTDETRLQLRNSREMQEELSREKAVCDQIVRIAEMEVGRI